MYNSNIIDTDAGIGTILSNFSSEYINHVIEDSLMMKFRPFDGPMPNMVDVLNRQFLAILNNAPDYKDKIEYVRSETLQEIIQAICKFYNLSFMGDFESMEYMELYGIAHTMYDIFISRFTEYMLDFFVSYVIRNSDSIASYLANDPNTTKPKEQGLYAPDNFIDPKYILIHANINKVIYNMAGYDISLNDLLGFFLSPNDRAKMQSLLADNGDIYKTHYASYILDPKYSAGVLTNIKLSLQSKTQELINVINNA